MSLKISQMTAATSATIADLLAIVQGGANKKATIDQVIGTVGADVAAATTTNLTGSGISVTITGNTTITGFTSMAAGTLRIVTFSGSPTLSHNATSFILPGGTVAMAPGYVGIFVSLGSGNWKCLAIIGDKPVISATEAAMLLESSDSSFVTPLVQKYGFGYVKAWCFWNMNDSGSPSIYDSYNVSGITDAGVGTQRVNFTTGFLSGNTMCVTAMTGTFTLQYQGDINPDYVHVTARNSAGTLVDSAFCSVQATGEF